jgi:MFS family permease
MQAGRTPIDDATDTPAVGLGYKAFALAILLAANILNYADRNLLGAVSPAVKAELGVTDADLGFLAGTSFVLFNALLGIALGRIGDRWRRNRLLALGIGLWSVMTVLSGLAATYGQLVAARIGVGVGEATMGAVGYSMLADIFPPRQRAAVFSIFICGPFIGLSLSLGFGGWIADRFHATCLAGALCLPGGWRAAFVMFGLVGAAVAVLVAFLGEPLAKIRAKGQGGRLFAEGLYEISLMIPPLTLVQLRRISGARAVALNAVLLALIAALAFGLIALTGSVAQWCTVGLASYALVSWCQAQVSRDPALFRLTIGSQTFVATVLGAAMLSSVNGALSFWATPLAVRTFHMTLAGAGRMLGAAIGGGSLAGTLLGGVLTDLGRRRFAATPFYVSGMAAVGGAVMLGFVLGARTPVELAIAMGGVMAFLATWAPAVTALLQDLVLPTMRGRTAALYVATSTLIGGSLGPYGAGRLADAFKALRPALACFYVLLPLGLLLFILAARGMPKARERRAGLSMTAEPSADPAAASDWNAQLASSGADRT